MNPTQLQQIYTRQAGIHYVKSDKERWNFNLWCHLAMYGRDGKKKYERGATLAIADEHGISEDTVEVSGNAYTMFRQMCEFDDGKFRSFVFAARSLKYVHTSHFRALWEAKERYNLSVQDCLAMLVDIVQAEGGLSSRKIDAHTRERFGDTRDWTYYATRASKELTKTLGQPDLPNTPEKVGNLYHVELRHVTGKVYNFHVLAFNKSRAEEIARNELKKEVGAAIEEVKCIGNEEISVALTDSKNLLNVACSWLGDSA